MGDDRRSTEYFSAFFESCSTCNKDTMVRLAGFAVINEEGRAEHDASQQTIEALESRVIDEYERALREIQANNSIEAEVSLWL